MTRRRLRAHCIEPLRDYAASIFCTLPTAGQANKGIPGIGADGRFASRDELRARFAASQSGVGDAQTIAMCGSGER